MGPGFLGGGRPNWLVFMFYCLSKSGPFGHALKDSETPYAVRRVSLLLAIRGKDDSLTAVVWISHETSPTVVVCLHQIVPAAVKYINIYIYIYIFI